MPIHKFFFYLFLLSLPTQLGRHFWPEWSYIWGLRIDYLAPTVYLSDILLGLTLVAWASSWNWSNLTNWASLKKRIKQFISTYIYYISICILSVFLLLVSFQTASSPLLWLYKLVQLAKLALLGVYVAKTTKTKTDLKRIINLLLIGAVFQSLLAVAQFVRQESLGGIFWWLGERTFNITTPGIAKIALENPLTGSQALFLRPYGTFSHPNSLAGYLLIILILAGLDLHGYVAHHRLNKPEDWIGAAKRIYTDYSLKFVFYFRKAKSSFAYSFLLVSLLLTFSRSAWLVGLIVFTFYLISKASAEPKKSHLTTILLILGILYTVYGILYTSTVSDPQNFQKRWQLTLASWEMIKSSPLIGVGFGHFIPRLAELPQKGFIYWLQPVHNIFLLVMAEVGLVGLAGFLGVLGVTYKRLVSSIWYLVFSIKKKKNHFLPLALSLSLTAILLTGLADHYWLTLQQNQLLFALVLGLCWADFKVRQISP